MTDTERKGKNYFLICKAQSFAKFIRPYHLMKTFLFPVIKEHTDYALKASNTLTVYIYVIMLTTLIPASGYRSTPQYETKRDRPFVELRKVDYCDVIIMACSVDQREKVHCKSVLNERVH